MENKSGSLHTEEFGDCANFKSKTVKVEVENIGDISSITSESTCEETLKNNIVKNNKVQIDVHEVQIGGNSDINDGISISQSEMSVKALIEKFGEKCEKSKGQGLVHGEECVKRLSSDEDLPKIIIDKEEMHTSEVLKKNSDLKKQLKQLSYDEDQLKIVIDKEEIHTGEVLKKNSDPKKQFEQLSSDEDPLKIIIDKEVIHTGEVLKKNSDLKQQFEEDTSLTEVFSVQVKEDLTEGISTKYPGSGIQSAALSGESAKQPSNDESLQNVIAAEELYPAQDPTRHLASGLQAKSDNSLNEACSAQSCRKFVELQGVLPEEKLKELAKEEVNSLNSTPEATATLQPTTTENTPESVEITWEIYKDPSPVVDRVQDGQAIQTEETRRGCRKTYMDLCITPKFQGMRAVVFMCLFIACATLTITFMFIRSHNGFVIGCVFAALSIVFLIETLKNCRSRYFRLNCNAEK